MIKLAINNLSINLFSFSQWSPSFRDIDHYPWDARFSTVTIENLNLKGVTLLNWTNNILVFFILVILASAKSLKYVGLGPGPFYKQGRKLNSRYTQKTKITAQMQQMRAGLELAKKPK